MPLGEFSINSFGFLSDFWRKSQKGANRKTGHHGPLRHSEGHPHHSVGLRRSEGCHAEVKCFAAVKSLFTVRSFRIFVSEYLVFVPR